MRVALAAKNIRKLALRLAGDAAHRGYLLLYPVVIAVRL
jgi:hypothetical protein